MDPVMAGAKVIFSVSEGGIVVAIVVVVEIAEMVDTLVVSVRLVAVEIAEMVDTLVVFVRLVAVPLAAVAVTRSADTCMVVVLARVEKLVI